MPHRTRKRVSSRSNVLPPPYGDATATRLATITNNRVYTEPAPCHRSDDALAGAYYTAESTSDNRRGSLDRASIYYICGRARRLLGLAGAPAAVGEQPPHVPGSVGGNVSPEAKRERPYPLTPSLSVWPTAFAVPRNRLSWYCLASKQLFDGE